MKNGKHCYTPEQFNVARKKGTEYAFWVNTMQLKNPRNFPVRQLRTDTDAVTKFDFRTGWPSFYAPVSPG